MLLIRRREARVRRALARLPRTSVMEAPDGKVVKIVGVATPAGPPLITPLSESVCIYYEILVEELRWAVWRKVFRESHHADLILRDESGDALVRLGGAITAALLTAQDTSSTSKPPNPAMVNILSRNSNSFPHNRNAERKRGLLGRHRDLRFTEWSLTTDRPLAVAGLARWDADPESNVGGSYREAPQRLILQASPRQPLFAASISDLACETASTTWRRQP